MEAVIGVEVSTDIPDPYIMRRKGERAKRKWGRLQTERKTKK